MGIERGIQELVLNCWQDGLARTVFFELWNALYLKAFKTIFVSIQKFAQGFEGANHQSVSFPVQ